LFERFRSQFLENENQDKNQDEKRFETSTTAIQAKSPHLKPGMQTTILQLEKTKRPKIPRLGILNSGLLIE